MSLQSMLVGDYHLDKQFGVYIDTSMMFNKPKKDVESIIIPGRDGALIVDYGTFQNVIITVPCFIHGDFETKFTALINYLGSIRGYTTIRFTNDWDHYRLAAPIMAQTPTVRRVNEDGWFDLSFNCKPFRYRHDGEHIVGFNADTIYLTNPTRFDALPLIVVKGYGTITIRNTEIEIAQHPSGIIYIDSEKMAVYGGLGINYKASDYVTITSGDYPRLEPGTTTIHLDSTLIGSVNNYIVPKWREL